MKNKGILSIPIIAVIVFILIIAFPCVSIYTEECYYHSGAIYGAVCYDYYQCDVDGDVYTLLWFEDWKELKIAFKYYEITAFENREVLPFRKNVTIEYCKRDVGMAPDIFVLRDWWYNE